MQTYHLLAFFASLGMSLGAVQLTLYDNPNCQGGTQQTTVNNDSCDSHINGFNSFMINSISGISTQGTLSFYADGSICSGSTTYKAMVGSEGGPKGCQNTQGSTGSIGLYVSNT